MVNLGGSDRLMHCQLLVELQLFYQLTGSSDSVYLALELCVEMLHFPHRADLPLIHPNSLNLLFSTTIVRCSL